MLLKGERGGISPPPPPNIGLPLVFADLIKHISIKNSPIVISFNKFTFYMIHIAWEPQVGYSRRLPALERFYREIKFSLLRSTHSTLDLKTKLRTFPWVSQVPQSKFEVNQSRSFWVKIGQTNRQTDREITTLYR